MHAFAYSFIDASGSGRNDMLFVAVIAATCTGCGVIGEGIVASKVKAVGRNFFMADAAFHVCKQSIGSEDQFRNCWSKEKKCHKYSPKDDVFHA